MTSDSFPSALADYDDAALRTLIRTRPDAFYPVPPSIASLATRLALPRSAAKALRKLTAADIAMLEQLADAGAELSPVDATEWAVSLAQLRRHALVYGPDAAVRIAPGTLSALPPGWRITDVAPEGMHELLADLPATQRKVLDTLAASGSVGTTKMASPDADPAAPIPQLIAKGLLIRVDANTVRLSRPVRDAVKGHVPRIYPLNAPAAPAVDQAAVDEAATVQGLHAVRQMRQLIMALLDEPIALNKDGTVGVRAVNTLTKQLGFDPALCVTVGESAGLISRGAGAATSVDGPQETDVLAATKDGLTWLDATLADQWAIVLAGWVASPWRLDVFDGPTRLLSQGMHSPDVRPTRMTIVRHGGDLQRILFYAPLTAAGISAELIDATVAEATAVGALAPEPSTPLTAVLTGADVAAATRELVPASVDKLIAQADMTVLAPGPLEPDMAAAIETIAELESPGLASVWRISDASVKRALDTGRTADEIHAWLEEHVLGDVPQAITFLIDDTARTHGAIRAGAAGSYVRSADPALIATAAERLDGDTLRIIAPTVAVSELSLPQLMVSLRRAGLQPTAEDAQGAQINMAPEPVLVLPTPSQLPRLAALSAEQEDHIIARLRDGAVASPDPSSTSTLEVLRTAVRGRRHVTVGYVDKNGRGTTLTVLPLSVSAGQVDALDEATDRVIRIALPRITKVVMA